MRMIKMMSTALPSVIWASLLFAHFTSAAKKCYAPDGKTTADSRFLPCIGFDHVDSMCCRLNDTYPDVCQSNGLCYWPHANKYYRDYCTDKSFDSPNCLNKTICADAATGKSQVTICGDGSFCCGDTNECCTEGNKFTLNPTLVSFDSNATATATVTATATATSTLKNGDTESSKNIAIGAGVGVPLGVLAIAMLGAGFWWGRQNTRAKYEALKQNELHTAVMWQAASNPINELDSTVPSKGPIELPAHGEQNQMRGQGR